MKLEMFARLRKLAAICVLAILSACDKAPSKEVIPSPPPKTFKFGAVIPQTGPGSALGDLIKRGLELGIESVNKTTNGVRIQMILEDSKTNPSEGLTAFRKLVDADAIRTVLVAFSAVCNAIAPAAEESKVLMVGMTTSMPGLTANRNYVLRFFPNADMLAGTIGNYAATNFSRVAVMYADDEYGKNTFLTFQKIFQKDSRQIVFSESFQPNASEFRETVIKMLDRKPDAIYLPGYGPGYITLIKQIRERNPEVPILGDSPLTNPPVYRAAGAAAEGIVVPATLLDAGIAETAEQIEFLRLYQARFKENPSINVCINYDFIRLLANAVQKTDGSPENIRKYIIEASPYKGISGLISHDLSGESVVQVTAMQIKGGAIIPR